MTRCRAYARLELREGWKSPAWECLDTHLACVAAVAAAIQEAVAGEGVELAAVSGLVHDIGKALYSVSGRDTIAWIEGGGEGSLSFRYHEVLSAALLGTYLWFNGTDGYWEAVRAVAMHHQGLRGVSAHVYSEGFTWIAAAYSRLPQDGRSEVVELMTSSLGQAASMLPEGLADAAKLVEGLAKWMRDLGVHAIVEALNHGRTLLPHWLAAVGDTFTARTVTGSLMLADSAVARTALEKTAGPDAAKVSTYVREALLLARRAATRAKLHPPPQCIAASPNHNL